MKVLASLLLVLAAGCAPTTLASLVPRLELGLRLRRVDRARALSDAARGEVDTTLVAWLSWRPVLAAQAVVGPLALSPEAWLAPCELDDADCLAESAEVESELAAALAPCALDDASCLTEDAPEAAR